MPQRLARTLLPQPLFNTIVAALLLLLTGPGLVPIPDPSGVHVALDGSAPAKQFGSLLSLVLTFDDRMGTAGFARLPVPLVTDGSATMREYRAGDLAYLPSEQSIVVFFADGSAVPDDGLVLLGRVTSGIADVETCVRDCAVQLMGAAAEGAAR